MILHITDRAAWRRAVEVGSYRPASLDAEGFIHCSTEAQLLATANRFFRGQPGLVVLCIDESRLPDDAPLRYEAPAAPAALGVPAGVDEDPAARFPHLYGPLPVSAVVRVVDLDAGDDGLFAWPVDLKICDGR